jgi:hypothetical protein
MKNFSRFSILAAVLLALAGTVHAAELITSAVVDVVDGVEITETTQMNFGVLANSAGAVVINPLDNTYTDAAFIVWNNTAITRGEFTVESVVGIEVTASVTPGVMPTGLDLATFTFRWDGTTPVSTANYTMETRTVPLYIGATLTLDATATLATAVDLPYTLEVAVP